MLRRFFTAAVVSAVAIAAVAPVAAEAQYHGGRFVQVDRGRGGDDHWRGDRGYYGRGGGPYYGRGYDRGRCRDSGTGGAIIGAIAGGLLGNQIGRGAYDRGDAATGTIVGAGVGALAGRAIDRGC